METKNKNKEVIRMLHTCTDVHVREAVEGEKSSRTITGYAILFGVPSNPLWSDEDSEAREVIAKEAITKELLDGQDIKFTMFHDRQLILARSRQGIGTLKYSVDDKGVSFSFDAPNTADGDKALELVRRGDITGCSFMFSTRYYDDACVVRTANVVNGVTIIVYTVKAITSVHDFTLAADPAYPDTSVEAREFADSLHKETPPQPKAQEDEEKITKVREQVRDMRRTAGHKVY